MSIELKTLSSTSGNVKLKKPKYATEAYVDDAIANLDIPEAEVDLTGYATEAYVDDAISNIDVDDKYLDVFPYYEVIVNGSYKYYRVNILDMKYNVPYALPTELCYEDGYKGIMLQFYIVCEDGTKVGLTAGNADTFMGATFKNSTIANTYFFYTEYPQNANGYYAINASDFTTKTNVSKTLYSNVKYLGANNNTEFTPTKNYAPATKKYVDDAVAGVEVDLTGYATETYVDEAVNAIEIPEVDLSNYATKEEIPSIEGLATEAYVDEAISNIEIDTSETTSIPSYWQEHLEEKIETIKALQDEGGKDAFSFIVITDSHYYSNLAKLAPTLAKEVADECGIKYVLNLGDTQNRGSWITKELVEEEWQNIRDMFAPVRDRLLSTQGNHDGSWGATLNDTNYPYNLNPNEIFNLIYRDSQMNDGVITDDSGTAYYVDDKARKVRYIVLNTHCNEYAENEDGSAVNNNRNVFRFTQSQYDFLTNDALITGLTDNWAVVVFAHVPVVNAYADLFGGTGGTQTVMREMLTAFRKKTSYSGSFAGSGNGEGSYTNLVGTITENTRLSSSGATKTSTGAITTDYIACSKGDVLRIKGIDIKSTLPDASNSPSIGVYNSSKTTLGVLYTSSTVADAVSTDTDGSTMYTLCVNASGEQIGDCAEVAYIRICGTPTGEDIVITLNEQIIESASSSYDTISVDVDFTNSKGKLVGYFSGHTHADYIYPYSDYGINIITTRCDAKEENDSTLNAERVAGTITEQSFDVITVNKATNTINITKIGAGNDRETTY